MAIYGDRGHVLLRVGLRRVFMIRRNGVSLYSGPLIRPSLERRERLVSCARTSHPAQHKKSTPSHECAVDSSPITLMSRLAWGRRHASQCQINYKKRTSGLLWTSILRAFNGGCLGGTLACSDHNDSQFCSVSYNFQNPHNFVVVACPSSSDSANSSPALVQIRLLSRPLSLVISVRRRGM